MVRSTKLFLVSVSVMVGTILGCDNGGGGTGVTVARLPTITIQADGNQTEADVVGKKRISLQVDPRDNRLLPDGEGVQVIYHFPDSAEHTESAILRPGSTNIFEFEVPGSETLRLCDKILFRWTIVYLKGSSGTARGTFIGQEETLRSTSERDGNVIRQALCAD